MNVLVAFASIRELDWWTLISKKLPNINFIFVNCSSRKFKNCIDLKDHINDVKNYQISQSEKFTIPLELLNFEREFYPNLSVNKLIKRIVIHYNAFIKIFNCTKVDLVFVENVFAFINALFLL